MCVISDRHRLCPGRPLAEQRRALVDQARVAAEAGVDLFQVRERDLFDRDLLETVQAIVRAAEGSRLRVLVNDRPDVAIAAGAHGVHLRGDGIPVEDARTLLSNLLVGRSVHDVDEARHAAGAAASFVLFGTVFATASKVPGHPIAGIAALGAVVRACPAPVLAVGGITSNNVKAVASAGAAGVAAIGWLATRDRGEMQAAVEACRIAFA